METLWSKKHSSNTVSTRFGAVLFSIKGKFTPCEDYRILSIAAAFVIIPFMFQKTVRGLEFLLVFFIFSAILSYSNPSLTDDIEKVRTYTRDIEFNYISWTADALLVKLEAASIDSPHILDRETQK